MVDEIQNTGLDGMRKNLLLGSMQVSQNEGLDDASLRQLDESEAGLRKAGKAFEGVFLSLLLHEMRNTTHPEEGMFGQSSAMQIFQDMQDDQVTKGMAAHSGLGLTEKIVQTYGRHLKGEKKEDPHSKTLSLDKVA